MDTANEAKLFALQQARASVATAKIQIELAFRDTDVGQEYETQFNELLRELDIDILELTPPPAPRWYVFDAHDCFADFDNATAAARQAEHMVADGHHGIEIKYFTIEERDAYLNGAH